MTNTAVVFGAEDAFDSHLCRHFLDDGWRVFALAATDATELLQPLLTHPRGRESLLQVDPQSIESVKAAARLVGAEVEYVDLLVSAIDFRLGDASINAMDTKAITQLYDINALAPIRFIEAFLPLTQTGLRRLCFVTDELGCISSSEDIDYVGYRMAKAALHMAVTNMTNDLQSRGYSFHLHAADRRSDPQASSKSAFNTFTDANTTQGRTLVTDDRGEECPF